MKHLTLLSLLGILLTTPIMAQEGSRFSFDIGGGFTQPVGATGRHLDEGWNIQGGGGFNFSPYVGLMINASYNSFGINSATLKNIGVPAGDIHVFSATLDPVVHLAPHGHFDVYVIGGGGIYHRYQQFTQPTVASVVGFDPFFGFFPAAVPSTQILASYSVNKPGVNIGAGVAIGTKWHGKLFAEARYHRIFMGSERHTDYIPVSFGFRW